MATYTLLDDGGATETIEAVDLADAKEHARLWAEDGGWDTSEGTIWVGATISTCGFPCECACPPDNCVCDCDDDGHSDTCDHECDDDCEEVARLTVEIDPGEPECTETAHDWQSPHEIVGGIEENPGVWGHGGGVVITCVCMHCGCARITDTWAQDPDTGEQGLTSVSYEPGRYSEDVAAA